MEIDTKRRRCSCGTTLNRYNANDQCWPCIDYKLAHATTLPVAKAPHRGSYRPRVSGIRHKPQAKQITDYQAVLNALKAMSGPFTAAELGELIGRSSLTVARYLARAEDDGAARYVGDTKRRRSQSHGKIKQWEAVEKMQDGAA